MLIKKKGSDLYIFENEQELKDFCSDNRNVEMRMFSDINIMRINKRTKRLERVNSSKL
jgi:hypothetical protein